MPEPIDVFIDALARKGIPQGKRVGREFRTICPAHDDHDPSLDYHADVDGTLLMICRSAGCKADAILGSLGLDWAALLPQAKPNGASALGDVVATYQYDDHDGTPLYRVHRVVMPDGRKRFFQERRTASGWESGLHGVKRVPYRLPRLLQGVRGRHTVFVVEGEKDVHTLEYHGFVATTNAQGARSWKRDFATYFEGAKRVVVLPDNDDDGLSWGLNVVSSLKGKVRDLRLIMLAESAPLADKEDVSDWFERHGGTKERLIDLVQGHDRPGGRLLRCAAEIEAVNAEYLWRPRLPQGNVTIFGGIPGAAKSFVATAIAATITTGGTFPDRDEPVMAGNVVYVPFEDEPGTVVSRFEAMDGNPYLMHVVDPRDNGDRRRCFDAINDVPRLLDEMSDIQGGVSLLVIDPVMHLFATLDADPNREREVRRALGPLVAWSQDTGAAILLITHLNRRQETFSQLERFMGAGAFVGVARSALLAGWKDNERVLTHVKNNYGQLGAALKYHVLPLTPDVGVVEWGNEAAIEAHDIRGDRKGDGVLEIDRWLPDFLAGKPDCRCTVAEVYEAAHLRGWSNKQVRAARDRLANVWHGKTGFGDGWEMWLVGDEVNERRERRDLA